MIHTSPAIRQDNDLRLPPKTIVLSSAAGAIIALQLAPVAHVSGALLTACAGMFAGGALGAAAVWCKKRLGGKSAKTHRSAAQLKGPVGQVCAKEPGLSPITGREAAAFTIRLWLGAQVSLEDSMGCGFDIQCANGQVIHVPAGAGAVEVETVGSDAGIEKDAVEAYLGKLDPMRTNGFLGDIFPHDSIGEAVIAPGERVEILSPHHVAYIEGGAPFRGVPRPEISSNNPIRLRRVLPKSRDEE